MPSSFSDFQALKYGDTEKWDKYKQEFRSINTDVRQFEKMSSVLPDKVPNGVAAFRNIKCNNPTEFRKLEREYSNYVNREKFKTLVDSGNINLKVREQKQKEHRQGEKAWKHRVKNTVSSGGLPANAFFKNIEVQELINEYSGSGVFDFRRKDIYPREYVDTKEFVGTAFDFKTGRYIKSKRIAIHYSSKGVHAYPVPEMEVDK